MKSLSKTIASALCLPFISSSAGADVIYLTNGNVLVVDKAWEEGVEVRYQASGKVQTLPKSVVKRIQEQTSVAVPEGTASPRYGIAIDDLSPAGGEKSVASKHTNLRGGT